MAFNKLFSFISFQLIHNGAISKDSPGLKGSEWKSWSRGTEDLQMTGADHKVNRGRGNEDFRKRTRKGVELRRVEVGGGKVKKKKSGWTRLKEERGAKDRQAEKKKNVRHREVHRWFHTKKRREVRRALKMDDYNWWQQNCTKLCRAKARKVLWKYNFWHLNTSTDKRVSGT